jgi:RNA polymerase sigma-70 factor (ECF subfamily)
MLTIAIASLPPQQKKVYQLGKMEGKKYDEIASLLNISKETVKDHMMKASGSIKAYLLRNEGLLYMLVLFIRLCKYFLKYFFRHTPSFQTNASINRRTIID